MGYPRAKNSLEEALDKAFLEAAPSDRVFDWLRERKGRSLPPATTEMLLNRDDRFIDFSLASFCPEEIALRRLFERKDTALRCVILSNHFQWHSKFASLRVPNPVRLFQSDTDLERFLADSTPEELGAYLRNPGLEGRVLERVFDRSGALQEMPDGDWHGLVLTALHNPALREDALNEPALAELSKIAGKSGAWEVLQVIEPPYREAWRALGSLPPSPGMARALFPVVGALRFCGAPKGAWLDFLSEESLEERMRLQYKRELHDAQGFLSALVEKWTPPSDDPGVAEYFVEVQCLIAEAAARSDEPTDLIRTLMVSPIRSVRGGAYRSFKPRQREELDAALNEDGAWFVENACRNPWFFLRSTSVQIRKRMAEIAETTETGDEHGPARFNSMFRYRGEVLEESDPTRYDSGNYLLGFIAEKKEEIPDPQAVHLLQTDRLFNEVPAALTSLVRVGAWSRLLLWALLASVAVLLSQSC